jgi:3-deoxy-7-phosphoheptulonate synthase
VSDLPARSRRGVVVAGIELGGDRPIEVIAGPCSVEGFEQLTAAATAVRAAGVRLLRGGAFKPRTSPYSFQGLGQRGLDMLREVADMLRMGVVSEALATEDVPAVARAADMIQIGARNMANRALLRATAATGRPILLKRGPASTIDEVLGAVDYLAMCGTEAVVVCERGSRTFEPATRNSVDIAAVPDLQRRTGLPVVIDPSHGTGRWDLVTSVAAAGIAAGADGVLVEVHPDPDRALSDGGQSLRADQFDGFMRRISAVAAVTGRAAAGGGGVARAG